MSALTLFAVFVTTTFGQGLPGEQYQGYGYGHVNVDERFITNDSKKTKLKYKTYFELAREIDDTPRATVFGISTHSTDFATCDCPSITEELCKNSYCSSDIMELEVLYETGDYQSVTGLKLSDWGKTNVWLANSGGSELENPHRIRRLVTGYDEEDALEEEDALTERMEDIFRRRQPRQGVARAHKIRELQAKQRQLEGLGASPVGQASRLQGNTGNVMEAWHTFKSFIKHDPQMCTMEMEPCRVQWRYRTEMLKQAIDRAFCGLHDKGFWQTPAMWVWCNSKIWWKDTYEDRNQLLRMYIANNWDVYEPDFYRSKLFLRAVGLE